MELQLLQMRIWTTTSGMSVKTSKSRRVTGEVSSNTNASSPAHSPHVNLLHNRTLGWSLFSAIAVWLAFPPVGFWGLAWLAPYGWLRLINTLELDGKRPYRMIWLIGYGHWLLMTYWVTLPHYSAAIGWLFLAAYLSVYVLGFVAVARWLVHRAGWSSIIAAPISWVAMEVLRSYLFTGFALCPLSHSQVALLPAIQVASFTGAYGVSFLVMLGAATLERILHATADSRKRVLLSSGVVTGVTFGVLAYGWWSMQDDQPIQEPVKVAIVQGSLDTVFDGDHSRLDNAFKLYSHMTKEVTASNRIDLVIWPESMFRYSIVSYDPGLENKRWSADSFSFGEWSDISRGERLKLIGGDFRTTCLMGTGTEVFHADTSERYNTAALFSPSGEQLDYYHKMHPVMFGEYIPFGETFPWLYRLTPMYDGLSRGTEPKAMTVRDVAFVPNICFENTVPHLIRKQVSTLHAAGERTDVLVTLTNDGWFWGSALLDIHLACGIFRAIENDRPMLIAANTGFSAHISPHGRVLKKGPRRASSVVVTEVGRTADPSLCFYTAFGDVFAFSCVGLCLIGLGIAFSRKAAG